MPYATSADIIAEIKGFDPDEESSVTSDAVDDFLTQADAVINMYIGKRYTTPVTATAALEVVKKIEIDIVVYRIAKILNLKKSVPIPDSNIIQEVTEGSAYRDSMKMLAAIRDNKMDLPGETETSAAGGLASFHTEAGNLDIEPCFKKGEQQW